VLALVAKAAKTAQRMALRRGVIIANVSCFIVV
jgi:hypothetical protein